MRRLGIFCFFDEDGIVDSYIEYLLNDLKKNLEMLIIVVNGNINSQGLEILEKYADQIFTRKNKGFDAGAYKEIIVKVLGKKKIKYWDEILLCNDTFYGPFVPFKTIFDKMQGVESDFWGLNYVDNNFLSHIQSYFLVFKKKILMNDDLYDFFEKNINMQVAEIEDVYAYFENGIFLYLKSKGYKYSAYSNVENYDIYRSPGICIEKYQFPILKKKCFLSGIYDEKLFIKLLKYIYLEKEYNIRYIIQNINRIFGIKINMSDILNKNYTDTKYIERKIALCIEKEQIVKFIKNNKNIYIYGSGIMARKVWLFFHEYILNFSGFIVSNEEKIKEKFLYNYPIKKYKEIEKGNAIIVGLGLKNSKAVISTFTKNDNVLFLWKDIKKNDEENDG